MTGPVPATAMASVNNDMMVASNTTAVITPMFIEGAAGVNVMAAEDNMPFSYVDWSMLQADVIAGGATFKVQRTTMGANQEMEPTGDVAYVTCGPFVCVDGMEAPEISIADSAVCAGWDPELTLQVGLIDNDVVGPNGTGSDGAVTDEDTAADGATSDDGIDLGWISSSSAVMTVKHIFAGVSNRGENYSNSGPDSKKGSDKPLPMDKKDEDTASTKENAGYRPGIHIAQDDDMELTAASGDNASACVAEGTYDDTIGSNHRPDNCFRVRVAGDAASNSPKLQNYLAGYSVEVAAKDSEVAWGDVDWEDNPFEDLKCESKTFVASEQVDVCAMFEDEVDQALSAGWGGSKGTVSLVGEGPAAAPADPPTQNLVRMWHVGVAAKADRFKTLWFDDNLNGKIKKDATSSSNMRPMQPDTSDGAAEGATVAANDMHDLYNDNKDDGNIEAIWQFLVDEDSDPIMGDFGKVDLVTAEDDWQTADNETTLALEACDADGADDDAETAADNEKWLPVDSDDAEGGFGCKTPAQGEGAGTAATAGTKYKTNPDGEADNYPGRSARKCDPDDGGGDEACDNEWSEDYEILFADGTFGCSTTRMVTIECEWDAQGLLASNPPDEPSGNLRTRLSNFAKCTAN